MTDFILTNHAIERSNERFNGEAFPVSGRRPTKRQIKQIKKQCPFHAKLFMRGEWRGRYFLYNRHINCVYCVAVDGTDKHIVTTVFPLDQPNKIAT